MCAEADWRDCHRQVIAQQLEAVHGITTTHILRNGGTEPHPCDYILPSHYGMEPSIGGACCGYRGKSCSIREHGRSFAEDTEQLLQRSEALQEHCRGEGATVAVSRGIAGAS